ncbi:hypothetical protein [Megamonas funiformis]|jgi:hypothetical protein|uniref:hypothetical protein n=1 Tax=Megamonas funiformis TaxID=437897 RepID=UPI00195BCF25|nr:hypothetical protein [Megamonas funiformis]MBM6727493.1 hypothetical protein [Megamonas funiformis]MCX4131620.1 hypothetical protein [Megamonas funiformis]
MEKREILIIGAPDNFVGKVFSDAGYEVIPYYRKTLISRKHRIFNFPKMEYYLFIKNIEVEKYKLIIIFDFIYAEDIIKYVRRRNKYCKIIYWLWDTIGSAGVTNSEEGLKHFKDLIKKQKLYNFTISSFDKNDCIKYKLKYNNQTTYRYNLANVKLEFDTFFCGREKGRINYLIELNDLLNNVMINSKIIICLTKKNDFKNNTNIENERLSLLCNKFEIIHSKIDYKEILNYINKSKCLIDIVQNGQCGLSWRALEAMFYRKKLITNFKDIKEYDFYKKDNIFIIGEDDLNNIKNFVNTGYVDIPENIIKKYTIDGWIENFINFK